MAKHSELQERLFDFLQRMQSRNQVFGCAEIVEATGYKEGSVRPYLSKMLDGRCVKRLRRAAYRAYGMKRMKLAKFRFIMTQNKVPRGLKGWKTRMRDLAVLGKRRGYPVGPTLRTLARRYSLTLT